MRRAVTVALFVTLGLLGAFLASTLADRSDSAPPASGLQPASPGFVDRAAVRVEVLNGSGEAGLARNATHALRTEGFDVVFFGNAGRFDHAHSMVLDRVGDPRGARAVAHAMGIDSVVTAVDSSLMLEVTIVLGDDWPPPPTAEQGWAERLQDMVARDTVGGGGS